MAIFQHGDETDSNRPEDSDGDGPVTIEDRTEPGGQGSPGSNQSKAEPMSPTGTHSQPLAVPDLADMNVGAADPQAPRHPAAAGSGPSTAGGHAHEPAGQGDDASVPLPGDTPSPGTSEEHRVVAGTEVPDADETA